MASAPGWQRTPFLQSIDELMTYGLMVYVVVIPARLRVRKYKIPDISLTHKHTSIYVGMREPRIRSTHSFTSPTENLRLEVMIDLSHPLRQLAAIDGTR